VAFFFFSVHLKGGVEERERDRKKEGKRKREGKRGKGKKEGLVPRQPSSSLRLFPRSAYNAEGRREGGVNLPLHPSSTEKA
jgi:hypothetical protein